ncbi:MAG: hypothetical protein QY309_06535 [Cyclobacteriaceae bacterium]|nr:MAG: hypothetical protein QY309_06535 [Cyclobacteriaceae bacterium]
MKLLLTLILWTVLLPIDSDSEIDCKTFRTGKFRLVDKDQEYIIERNDSIQIENDLKKNTMSRFKVTWVTDCEYELDILEANEEAMNFFKGKTLSIQILETSDNGYKYEAKLKGTDLKLIHRVERVN